MASQIDIRLYQIGDLSALVELTNRAVAYDQEDGQTSLEELRSHFERPYFNPEQNCLVAVRADGQIVGYVTAELDPRMGRGWGNGYVDPDFRRQGIGARLLAAADARHAERAVTQLPPAMPLWITRFSRDTHTAKQALFEAAGYSVARVSWLMHIDLADGNDVPPLPDGFTLRPFSRERDARAVWEAEQNIFRDNWGYIEPPFEVWETYMFGPHHADALWLVAMDGDAIAGLCLCQPKNEAVGWVNSLGVQAAYRGRGLGSALLRRSFQVMRSHGLAAAELEVDSENKSNAVALYERAGMRVDRRYLIYGKTLREPAPSQ